MHHVATFARTNTIGWMLFTVILGAGLILTGWLPLQLLGALMIAIGVVTPIALTGALPDRHGASSRRDTSAPRRGAKRTRTHRDEPTVSND